MDKNTYDRMLNRVGEWIAEISKEQYLMENMPLCWARFAVVDVILPEIALAMERQNESFLERTEVLKTMDICLRTTWPKCVLKNYGFMADGERTRKALLEKGAEWILEDLIDVVGILGVSDGGYVHFTDGNDRKLFLWMAVGNRIEIALEQIG